MENTTSPETSELSELIAKCAPFIHEIRKRIISTALVFAIATAAGFFFYENIIKYLIDILSLKGINIVFTSPFQFINLAISCGLAVGLIFVFPLLIFQILSFLKPALRVKEYEIVVRALPFSIFLFVFGFLFGFVIMKWQIQIFLTRSIALGIGNILDISHLLTTVLLTSVLMGIAFQFPIVMFLLMRIGIINRKQLIKQRAWIYLASFIFAILLPADSILADILLTLPIVSLFELALILDRFYGKR